MTVNPSDLNAAEIALLDRHASKLYAEQIGNGGDAEAAYRDGLRLIEARRALFAAPETEEPAKAKREMSANLRNMIEWMERMLDPTVAGATDETRDSYRTIIAAVRKEFSNE